MLYQAEPIFDLHVLPAQNQEINAISKDIGSSINSVNQIIGQDSEIIKVGVVFADVDTVASASVASPIPSNVKDASKNGIKFERQMARLLLSTGKKIRMDLVTAGAQLV